MGFFAAGSLPIPLQVDRLQFLKFPPETSPSQWSRTGLGRRRLVDLVAANVKAVRQCMCELDVLFSKKTAFTSVTLSGFGGCLVDLHRCLAVYTLVMLSRVEV